jgi:hypothetical protein
MQEVVVVVLMHSLLADLQAQAALAEEEQVGQMQTELLVLLIQVVAVVEPVVMHLTMGVQVDQV